MKQKYTKIIAGLTAAALSAGFTFWYADGRKSGSISANEETTEVVTEKVEETEYVKNNSLKPSKKETVYVSASAVGAVENIKVSSWLKNPGHYDTITDISNLSNISNVKGNETFTEESGNIIWQANGEDIYYQGDSNAELPVDVKVTYYLDGKEIKPDDLAGKSGKVKIRFDYTNHEKKTINVNGNSYTVSVPFAAVTGLVLDNEKFTNVEAENGKIISDGKRIIAAGGAFPGLSDSLKLDCLSIDGESIDIDIPEYFEITADVIDFSLSATVTMVTNELVDIPFDGEETADKLRDTVKELTDASEKLTDGTSELYDGIEQLLSGSGDLCNGIEKLADGSDELDKGASALNTGASKLSEGANDLDSGVAQLNMGFLQLMQNAPVLRGGSEKFYSGLVQLQDSLKDVSADTSQIKQLLDASSKIKSGIQELGAGAEQLKQAVSSQAMKQTLSAGGLDTDMLAAKNKECMDNILSQVAELSKQLEQISGVEGYEEQVKQLQYQIQSLSQTAELIGGNMAYIDASQKYIDGAGNGFTNLIDGISNLSESYNEFDAAISKLAEKLSETAENMVRLKDAVDQLSSAYGDINNGIQAYTAGTETLYDGSIKIGDGIKKLSSGASELKNGVISLASGTSALKNGIGELKDGGNTLTDGISKLKDGSEELKNGMSEFDEEGIQKIADIVNGDISDIVDRMSAVTNVSEGYNTFSGASDDMECSVKFVIETKGI